MTPDWFEAITGFREGGYEETQARLWVEDGQLCSTASARRCGVGTLETPTLAELRQRVAALPASAMQGATRTRVRCLVGDARALHADPALRGALFQVASQFNLLEMVGPDVTPEEGVTRYVHDPTQGPACAVAAGAGTIYRNYLAPVRGQKGQRANRQIDCLADLGHALGHAQQPLWDMRNGYALCHPAGLARIDAQLREATPEALDALRCLLRIGLHWNVEVTDVPGATQHVSQAYCSALPVAYTRIAPAQWERFARLVLEAAYEATLLAAALNRQAGGPATVLLTRIGGGVFGNPLPWINAAMERAIRQVPQAGLDVVIVCFGAVPGDVAELAERFGS